MCLDVSMSIFRLTLGVDMYLKKEKREDTVETEIKDFTQFTEDFISDFKTCLVKWKLL